MIQSIQQHSANYDKDWDLVINMKQTMKEEFDSRMEKAKVKADMTRFNKREADKEMRNFIFGHKHLTNFRWPHDSNLAVNFWRSSEANDLDAGMHWVDCKNCLNNNGEVEVLDDDTIIDTIDCPECRGLGIVQKEFIDCNDCIECEEAYWVVCENTNVGRFLNVFDAVATATLHAAKSGMPTAVKQGQKYDAPSIFTGYSEKEWSSDSDYRDEHRLNSAA